MFPKGNRREEMTTDDADLTGIFRSRRNGGNGRNFNYYLILMSIDNHAAWRAQPFLLFPLFLREIKIIVSSVRDKNNSHGDWRKDFYNGRNGNYRKINGKGYVFRIKQYFWDNYGNYDNFFQR